jgi:hypothetical protein
MIRFTPKSGHPPASSRCQLWAKSLLWAKSRRSRQIVELVYCGAIMQSHAGRDGCEAIEFAEATYLVASIS